MSSSSPWRARAAALMPAVLVPVALLAAACTSSSTPPQPSASVAPPNSSTPPGGGQGPGSPPASSPAPGSQAPTSPPAAQGPQPCPTSGLQARTGGGSGAAGSTYLPIVFTNISGVTCTLFGYPGVSLAGGSPVAQIGAAADRNPGVPAQAITLGPGDRAFARLRIVTAQNYPPSRCHLAHASYLQVYPPNQTTPIYVAYSAAACSKPVHLLTVDAVRPGTGG